MIMCNQPNLQLTQLRLWEQLKNAWNATFHCDLHPNGLEKWLEDGPMFSTQRNRNGWPKPFAPVPCSSCKNEVVQEASRK
jgi:hypothetical protein